jgi:hypothetical protein
MEPLLGEQIGEPEGRLHVNKLETGADPLDVEVEPAFVAVFVAALEASVDAVVSAAAVAVVLAAAVALSMARVRVVAFPLMVVSKRPAVGEVVVAVPVVVAIYMC